MKDASQFPITELFGCQPGYPLNKNLCPPGQGYHNGIDYGCPTGTPIVVNGVEIGISGATGAATGPHLHVGRWVNGKSTDPGAGNGFNFNSAKVTEISQDSVNGKYVRLQADGASWVYLHMSNNSLVKVDQVLTVKGDEPMIEAGDVKNLIPEFVPRQANQGDINFGTTKNGKDYAYALASWPERKAYVSDLESWKKTGVAIGKIMDSSATDEIKVAEIKKVLN